MTAPTPDRVQEIRARAEALEADRVFPGFTWTASAANEKSTLPPENAWVVEDVLKRDTVEIRGSVGIFGSQQHAEFIAHARKDIPWLLDRIAKLEDAAICPSRIKGKRCVLPVRHRADHVNADGNHFWSDEYADRVNAEDGAA